MRKGIISIRLLFCTQMQRFYRRWRYNHLCCCCFCLLFLQHIFSSRPIHIFNFICLINSHKFLFLSICREMRLVSDTLNECFEPLILPPVSVQSLQRWGRKNEVQLQPTDYSQLEKPRHRASPFPCTDQVNNRFIIW